MTLTDKELAGRIKYLGDKGELKSPMFSQLKRLPRKVKQGVMLYMLETDMKKAKSTKTMDRIIKIYQNEFSITRIPKAKEIVRKYHPKYKQPKNTKGVKYDDFGGIYN